MHDFVLGERRGEARWSGTQLPDGFLLAVPGVRLTEILDASARGARVRALTPLRPGRTALVRFRASREAAERQYAAVVQRCWVQRLGKAGVVYEAGLSWEPTERGAG